MLYAQSTFDHLWYWAENALRKLQRRLLQLWFGCESWKVQAVPFVETLLRMNHDESCWDDWHDRKFAWGETKDISTIGFNAKSRCWVLKYSKYTPHFVWMILGKHHALDFHWVQISKVKNCECCDVCAIRDLPWNGFGAMLCQSWSRPKDLSSHLSLSLYVYNYNIYLCARVMFLIHSFMMIHEWYALMNSVRICLILLEGCTKRKRQRTPFFLNEMWMRRLSLIGVYHFGTCHISLRRSAICQDLDPVIG